MYTQTHTVVSYNATFWLVIVCIILCFPCFKNFTRVGNFSFIFSVISVYRIILLMLTLVCDAMFYSVYNKVLHGETICPMLMAV